MLASEPTALVADKEAYVFAGADRMYGPTGIDSHIGVVVPTGGTLIYPDPQNPPKVNAGGSGSVPNAQVTYYYGDIYGEFSNAVANFWFMEWVTFKEPDGIFYGWRFNNRDLILRRYVKALFKWRGPGPYIAQTSAANGSLASGPNKEWQVGIAFAAKNVKSAEWGACHANGVNYNWTHDIGNIFAQWVPPGPQGLRVDGVRPGFTQWTARGRNWDPTQARFIRVVVDAD